MRLLARRRVLWDYLGGALWVLPTVSVMFFLIVGALLSRVSVDADSPLWPLAFQGSGEDARGILVVVSATMITVTGLVFALTIVALQIASGQYSPRLLRNFMRDRGTQVVLSVFVGAFAYSTAGLHTVGIQRVGGEAFVPRLAVSGSLVLGLASVGVLIYFIHHLARSIQIDAIMSQVEREARWVIDDLYPDQLDHLEPEQRCLDPPASATVLPASRSGYIQAVQPEPLVRAAADHDLVVRLARQVGDHVVEGTPFAWVWRRVPRAVAGRPPAAPGGAGRCRGHRVRADHGPGRSVRLRRLVDIGNKALSPAVNDPYTGIQAVQHLSVLLCKLAGRRLGDLLYHDEQGTLRLAVPLPQFADYLRLGTAQIRRSGAQEPGVTRSLIQLSRTSAAGPSATTGAGPAPATSGWYSTTPNVRPPSPPTSRQCRPTELPRSPRLAPTSARSRTVETVEPSLGRMGCEAAPPGSRPTVRPGRVRGRPTVPGRGGARRG
jgi:uncharacterized membrane protein